MTTSGCASSLLQVTMPSLADVLSQLRAQGAPESQVSRLSDLVGWASGSDNLLAIFLVGSYARGVGDRVSDLDLVAIVEPNHESEVLEAAHSLLSRANVLNQFTGTHATGGAFWKFVYLDFSSVEFHVFDTSRSFRLKRPCLSIWDPGNRLQSSLVDGDPIRHEDFAAYEHGDDGLVWELVDCIKWLSRGRTALAKSHLMKLAAQMRIKGSAP